VFFVIGNMANQQPEYSPEDYSEATKLEIYLHASKVRPDHYNARKIRLEV